MKKKSTYQIGENVQVRLYVGESQVWFSGRIIGSLLDPSTQERTYNVQLDSGRIVREIEPEDLRKG